MKLKFTDFIKDQWTSLPLTLPTASSSLSGKTVLITGANSGIGLETAKHFARMGAGLGPARLVVTCRTQDKVDEAVAQILGERQGSGAGAGAGAGGQAGTEDEAGVKVEGRVLELAEFGSVRAFVDESTRDADGEDGHARLDILVANAAVSPTKVVFTQDGWETTTQVNVLSTALLTLLLLPQMLATARTHGTTPRILVATSELHHMAPPFDADMLASGSFFRKYGHRDGVDLKSFDIGKQYFSTKAIVIFFVRALSARLHATSNSNSNSTTSQPPPLIICAPNPGLCRTAVRRDFTGPLRIITTLLGLVLGRTAEQGSHVYLWAALAPFVFGEGKTKTKGSGDESSSSISTSNANSNDLRGAYVSTLRVDEPSDYIVSADGCAAQERIWQDLVRELAGVESRVAQIVQDHLGGV